MDEAVDAFLNARFEEARSLLLTCDEISEQLLLLRTMLRLSELEEADLLADRLGSRSLSAREHGELLVLRFGLACRMGDDEQILSRRRVAKMFVDRADDTELECEYWFFDAFYAFSRQDLKRCEHSAWNAIHCDLTIAPTAPLRPSEIAPVSNSKARALQLLGLIRGSQERFHEQVRFLREAVVTLRKSPRYDLYVLALIYMNLSFQSRDLGLLDDIVTLEIIDTQSWPASLSMMKLQIAISLSWLYALQGSEDRALSVSKLFGGLDVSPSNLLNAIANCAAISRRCFGEIATRELDRGLKIFSDVLKDSEPDQWFCVPTFACELAYRDPDLAKKLMDEFEALPTNHRTSITIDRRSEGDLAFAKGSIALLSDRYDEAASNLKAAFDIWVDCGFRWQATVAAIEITKIHSIDTTGFIRYAKRESLNYPRSWLARVATHEFA